MITKQNILFLICLAVGAAAVIAGGLMMLIPVDTPILGGFLFPALSNFPFQDIFFQNLFWTGLALLLWNGLMNLAAAIAFLHKSPNSLKLSLLAGIMMLIWCAFKFIFLPKEPVWMSIVVACVATGAAQIVLSRQLMKKEHFRNDK